MIVLENKHLKLSIDELGAQWKSLIDKKDDNELLWQGSSDSWGRTAPLLFPIVGRLKENSYVFHGEVYSLNQHGFLRDNHLRVIHQSKTEVIFEFESDESTKEVYPFDFKLRITMALKDNKVKTKIVVLNESNYPMYFSLGGHPGFNVDMSQSNGLFLNTRKKKVKQYHFEGPYVTQESVLSARDFKVNEMDLVNTVALDNVKSATLTLENKMIKVSMKPTQLMAFWSPINNESQSVENLLCIEPWWGIGDYHDSSNLLKDKEGIIKLNTQESKAFEFSVSIEQIEKKPVVPKAIGPYSISSQIDNILFFSGQLPINPETNQIEVFSIQEQTTQVLENIKAVLSNENLSLKNVKKTTVFLKNMDDFGAMNEIYGQTFSEPYPARSAVEVARLPKDALIEIEVIVSKESLK